MHIVVRLYYIGYMKTLNIRIPEEVYGRLESVAKERGLTLSAYCRDRLGMSEDGLEKRLQSLEDFQLSIEEKMAKRDSKQPAVRSDDVFKVEVA